MTDQLAEELKPVRTAELLREFSDYTLAELVMEITEGRKAIELGKKSLAASVFARAKVEQELEDLRERINTSLSVLNGEEISTEEEDED